VPVFVEVRLIAVELFLGVNELEKLSLFPPAIREE